MKPNQKVKKEIEDICHRDTEAPRTCERRPHSRYSLFLRDSVALSQAYESTVHQEYII